MKEVKCPVCGTEFLTPDTKCNCSRTIAKEIKTVGKRFTIEEITSAMESLMNGTVAEDEGNGFAKKSKYYNKVLASGTIYNPYLVRRWLPSQFLGLMKRYDNNIVKAVKSEYDWKYVMNWLATECEKLAWLEKHDPVAYAERRRFLTELDAKSIIQNYVYATRRYLSERFRNAKADWRGNISVRIPYYKTISNAGKIEEEIVYHNIQQRRVPSEDWIKLQGELDKLLATRRDYSEIANVLKAFKPIPTPEKVSGRFVECFIAQGAYYTLKNLILFDGLKYSDNTGRCIDAKGSEQCLYKIIGCDSYVIYAILKKTISDNDYKF